MKQILSKTLASLFIVSLCLLPTVSQAQQRGQQGPPPIPNEKQIEKMVDDLTQKLELTEYQSARISKIYIDHFEKVKDQQSQDGNKEAQRKIMQSLKTDFERNVKAELTKEQQKKFDKIQQKRSTRDRGQRPPR